jgi:hypothetical protein
VALERSLAIVAEEKAALDRILAEQTAIRNGPDTWERIHKLAGLSAELQSTLNMYGHRIDRAVEDEHQTIFQVGRVLAALGF